MHIRFTVVTKQLGSNLTRRMSGVNIPSNRSYSNNRVLKERKVISLDPGLIHIKSGLTPQEQIELATFALKGKGPRCSFWKYNDNQEIILNSTSYRGRQYRAVTELPSVAQEVIQRNLTLSQKHDPSLLSVIPTHVIMLYYKSLPEIAVSQSGFIPWHKDNGENDGEGLFPVISFSIGDSCDFLINHDKPKINQQAALSDPINLRHRVHFQSGDILLFGGESRDIWHAIYKMYPHTAPDFLPFSNARLNFTFRYTPKLIGDETRFSTIESKYLPADSHFYKLSGMRKK